MKKAIMACTCALLLSTGGTFAQVQPAPGGAAHGDVGPGAGKGTTKPSDMKKESTTGMSSDKAGSSSSAPSSSGNVGPGTNNNAGPQPGGR